MRDSAPRNLQWRSHPSNLPTLAPQPGQRQCFADSSCRKRAARLLFICHLKPVTLTRQSSGVTLILPLVLFAYTRPLAAGGLEDITRGAAHRRTGAACSESDRAALRAVRPEGWSCRP